MAEPWYAIYQIASGDLVSTTTVLPNRLPPELASLELPRAPDWAVDLWDANGRTLITRAAPVIRDRVAEAETAISANLLLTVLTVGQRAALSDILQSHFGDVKAS